MKKTRTWGNKILILLLAAVMAVTFTPAVGYLPFSKNVGQFLFHTLSKLYETTSVIVTTHQTYHSENGLRCSTTAK